MSASQLRYCPICGHELATREDGGRRRPACPSCGYVHYTNPVPGVGMLIELDGGIVLIQRGHPPHEGEWSLPSGFVEADESAEEAAIREAEEETGLKTEIIELMGINSFPEGPPVSGIMIFYRMRPTGGELSAGDDAAAVRVFQPDEIPLLPFRTHREIMSEWLLKFASAAADEPQASGYQPPFIIRPGEPSDEQEILALMATIPANRSLTAEQWHDVSVRFREMPTIEIYVAQTRQTPPMVIGFISLSVVRGLTEGRALINDVAVLPTYQRQGVGAALLGAVMRRANQLNLGLLMVNMERANEGVRAFYASAGFAEASIMRLRLR